MRVAILGTGAMGTIFGVALARSGAEVVCYDRRADVIDAINTVGLRLEGVTGEHCLRIPACVRVEDIGMVDLALVLVDSSATGEAAEAAARCLGPSGYALTLQNGIGNLETLAERLGRDRVAAGITYNSGAGLSPGHARHTNAGPTVIGEASGPVSERLRGLALRFAGSDIPIELSDAVEGHIWSKFVHNCAINPVSALTALRPGEIWRDPAARALLERVLDEILAVVATAGIRLPEEDPRAEILEHCRVRYNRPSMLQHRLAGRVTEIGALNEALVARARSLGLATPVNEAIALAIRAMEASSGGRDRELDEAKLEAQAGRIRTAATVPGSPDGSC
jgi:2-dehydropantoate 2-reductase